MRYSEMIKHIDSKVEGFSIGLYTIQEAMHIIENDIISFAGSTPDLDSYISLEYKLYKHFMQQMAKAISKLQRHQD